MRKFGAVLFIVFVLALSLSFSVCVAATPPSDIGNYPNRIFSTTGISAIQMNMDTYGRGYLYDGNRDKWVKIPDIVNIQPSYSKTSNTMGLLYAFRQATVYDTSSQTWVPFTGEFGVNFTSFTRSKAAPFATQANDNLVLACGLNITAVYDYQLHKWIAVLAGADDSTDQLMVNMVLTPQFAKFKQLNGPMYQYNRGSGQWIKL